MRTMTLLLLLTLTNSVFAADHYARIRVSNLQFEGGKGPSGQGRVYVWWWQHHTHPFARLATKGDAYVAGTGRSFPWFDTLEVAVRSPQKQDVKGDLFIYTKRKWHKHTFRIKADQLSQTNAARKEFLRAKSDHYERLVRLQIPGTAWFRHQSRTAFPSRRRVGRNRNTVGFERTIDLASGRRAVAENLQLDRSLRLSTDNLPRTIDVNDIRGIRVRAFEWKNRIKGRRADLDSLAKLVPADQFALFTKKRRTLRANLSEADSYISPLSNLIGMRTNPADIVKAYQRQTGTNLHALGRFSIKSFAITGSDPFLEVGTDLAFLFETDQPKQIVSALRTYLSKRKAQFQIEPATENPKLTIISAQNESRSTSSFVTSLGNVVVVANSRLQLGKIIHCWQRRLPSMHALEEYHFFRLRYPKQKNGMLIVLTDAAIRKWCSPEWRIGNSRRLRVAAELAELQAAKMKQLVKGQAIGSKKLTRLGKVQRTDVGLHSQQFGSLAFMTPIAELSVDLVTERERGAYVRWRSQYESRWRRFDPIALSIVRRADGWKSDLTVMPLINSSEYNWIRQFTGTASIDPKQGDFHQESLMHAIFALKPSQPFIPPYIVSAELYVDDSPLWQRFWKRVEAGDQMPLKQNEQPPVGLVLNTKPNKGKITYQVVKQFFIGFKKNKWAQIKRGKLTYESTDFFNLTIFIAHTSDSVIATTNQQVIENALRRAKSKRQPPKSGWLGKQIGMRLRPGGVRMLRHVFRRNYVEFIQQKSFDALPILTEWKRLFPNEDPVAVHQRIWHEKLRCPAGKYVWNAKVRAMESTAFGRPEAPRFPKNLKTPLDGVQRIDLGITLEADGVRAAVNLKAR